MILSVRSEIVLRYGQNAQCSAWFGSVEGVIVHNADPLLFLHQSTMLQVTGTQATLGIREQHAIFHSALGDSVDSTLAGDMTLPLQGLCLNT